MKLCKGCNQSFPLNFFHKDSSKKSGIKDLCKICNTQRVKKWQASNPEKIKISHAKYRLEHSDKRKAWAKLDRAKNPSLYRERWIKWKSENQEKHKVNVTNQRVRHKAGKLKATPAWGNRDEIKEFYKTAQGLSMILGEWYEVDHIVPLRSKIVCGLHVETNLQVLLKSENVMKSNRYWPDMP